MKKLIVIGIILLSCVGIYLYAHFIGTSGLEIKEFKITNTMVSNNHGLKIVHFTDVHYGSSVFLKELTNMVDEINKIEPDIIFFTGDLFDRDEEYSKEILISTLSKLEANLGKYFILGNHDTEEANNILKSSGFVNISNTYKIIHHEDPFVISGISSNSVDDANLDEKLKSFNSLNNEYYSILLVHEPDIVNELNNDNYDLILAGHSHLGQVRLPIIGSIIVPEGAKDFNEQYYKLNETDLYISGGMGTSTLDIRLFNRPSINFYRLTKK